MVSKNIFTGGLELDLWYQPYSLSVDSLIASSLIDSLVQEPTNVRFYLSH